MEPAFRSEGLRPKAASKARMIEHGLDLGAAGPAVRAGARGETDGIDRSGAGGDRHRDPIDADLMAGADGRPLVGPIGARPAGEHVEPLMGLRLVVPEEAQKPGAADPDGLEREIERPFEGPFREQGEAMLAGSGVAIRRSSGRSTLPRAEQIGGEVGGIVEWLEAGKFRPDAAFCRRDGPIAATDPRRPVR